MTSAVRSRRTPAVAERRWQRSHRKGGALAERAAGDGLVRGDVPDVPVVAVVDTDRTHPLGPVLSVRMPEAQPRHLGDRKTAPAGLVHPDQRGRPAFLSTAAGGGGEQD